MADIAGIGSFTDIGGVASAEDREPRELTPEEEERRAQSAAERAGDTSPRTDPLIGGEDEVSLSSAAQGATATDDANEEEEDTANQFPEAGNEERDSAVTQSLGRVIDRFA
jgi:hypothetical protein